VQYGCGFSAGDGWLNFDNSPTLRIERIPVIGTALGGLAGNRQAFPGAILFGDICRGLPVATGTVAGAYASHVLEHLSLEDCRGALRNTFTMLKPGAEFRLIVPDLKERARRYLDAAACDDPEAASAFMRSSHLGSEQRPRGTLRRLRQLFGGSAHLWMWDEAAMSRELKSAGFVAIRRCAFNDSDDPMFARVEDAGRFIDADTGIRELALSARCPGKRTAHA